MSFPFYTEPTHTRGTIDNSSTNGARSTSTSSTEGRLVLEVADKISLLEPNKTPFTTLLTNVGKVYDGKSWKGSGLLKQVTGNPEFGWIQDYYGGRYARVGAAYNSTDNDVTMTVTGAGASPAYIFTVGDVIKNARTGENLLVVTIASATTITADRAFGTTAAAAGLAGDGIFIVGNVNEENGGARNINTTQANKETNYTLEIWV